MAKQIDKNLEKVDLFLAALSPYIEQNIPQNIEKEISGKDYVAWGDKNAYPKFLWDNYMNCTTLQSIINGTADYIAGDDVICNIPLFKQQVNKKGDTIGDIVQKIAVDYLVYGSFAIQVIKNKINQVAEIYWVDVSKLRSDKKNEVFFYSDDWSKTYGRVKCVTYPKYKINDSNPTSIYYFKGHKTRTTYGVPLWNAATKNAVIEQNITEFHLNEIQNNFLGSKLISFNNGMPDDNMKVEIEKNLNEKFSGAKNAGRFMISFSQGKNNQPTILDLASDKFDERYASLEKRNREQLFIAFRATPVLFGLVTESNGFSTNEYRDSFKLFNKCIIKPIQKNITDAFEKIFGIQEAVTITPFTINFEEDNNIEKVE